MGKHPNAAVAGGGTGLSVFIVWLLGHFHLALSAEDGAVVAGAVATIALFIGRNGLKGLWRRIWNGQDGLAMIEAVILLIIVAIVLLLIKVF